MTHGHTLCEFLYMISIQCGKGVTVNVRYFKITDSITYIAWERIGFNFRFYHTILNGNLPCCINMINVLLEFVGELIIT